MKNSYICNCKQYNFEKKNFNYWEDKNVTSDELLIIDYLKKNVNLDKKKILHIGIGNSHAYQSLNNNNYFYGISISKSEINKAKSINKGNYTIYHCDKYSNLLNKIFKDHKFDLIIDNNLKSYSCCYVSFNFMFKN